MLRRWYENTPSVTSVTASIVARTGCLIERSLRNTGDLSRRDLHAVGNLDALFGDDEVPIFETADNLETAVALASDPDRPLGCFSVLDDEDDRVFRRTVIPLNGSRRDNDGSL